ncbi:MAG TPA: DoxX family membrane protein [Baekduia sp.]|nr:DoxX family membrane protein [Baekduia sp.]
MAVLRTLGRGMIAALFVTAGVDVLRRPEPRAEVAHDALAELRSVVPAVPDDVTAVRANAAIQVVAATLLTLGKAPRAAAAVLAASLVPTTLAGHAFWTFDDPEQRAQQLAHFAKNLAILGGLILAALPPEEDV